MITIARYHRWGAIIIPFCVQLVGNALSQALSQQICWFFAEKADFTVPLLGLAGWKTVHERFAGRALGSNGVGMLQERGCLNTDQNTRSNKEEKETEKEDDKEKEEDKAKEKEEEDKEKVNEEEEEDDKGKEEEEEKEKEKEGDKVKEKEKEKTKEKEEKEEKEKEKEEEEEEKE